ncbi:MAG: O-antigen ligase family protein [Candidatus Acidiferrales bacterium]
MATAKRRTHVEAVRGPNSLASPHFLGTAWTLLFAGLLAALYFSSSVVTLWFSLIAFVVVALLAPIGVPTRTVDWILLLVLVYEIPSLLFSEYRANSIRETQTILIASLAFYCVRLTLRKPLQIVCLSAVLGLLGASLSLSAVRQFVLNAKRLHEAGFANLLAFRTRLMTPPWVLGNWLTLLLLTLPFSCILPAWFWQRSQKRFAAIALLCPICISAALCLSLSRAVFWSTVVFCVAWGAFMIWGRVVSARKGATLLMSMLLGLAFILACEPVAVPSIFSAYAGHSTSQTRSTEGRIAIWRDSLDVLRAHSLWGVGSSNAALALLPSADEGDAAGFASRTFSLPIQVLVEKGAIGFLLYSLFLVLVAREFVLRIRGRPAGTASRDLMKPKKTVRQSSFVASPTEDQTLALACCFGAGVVAVMMRELVYASLFEHTLTLALMLILCAFLVRTDQS